MAKIIVVGGGIIGLASAYYLQKSNHEVTIIEKNTVGSGCSEGNMGWIPPSISDPVPAPGVLADGFKWMFKKDSPLYLKPTKIPQLAPWLLSFMKYCTAKEFEKGLNASIDLNKHALGLYERILEDGVEFEYHRKGLLLVFKDEAQAKYKFDKLQKASDFGQEPAIYFNQQQLQEEEPLLNSSVKAGILLPGECHVRPESLNTGIAQYLKRNGATIKENEEVVGYEIENGQIVGVKLKKETIKADVCVIAAGAESAGLLKNYLGIKIPMISGKGYSLTLDSANHKFNHAMYFGDTRVGLTPFNNEFRIGGAMDLTGIDTTLNENRLKMISNSAKDYLNISLENLAVKKKLTGMRPMTPDGLPVIGAVPKYKNLYIATGHAMMGISMGLTTGEIVAQLVDKKPHNIDIKPFAIERFM